MPKRGTPPMQGELLQGTLDLLILKTLASARRTATPSPTRSPSGSEEVLQVEHGSLYPALHRLEDRGWIASFWGTSENNRRARYYRLTPKGRAQLAEQTIALGRDRPRHQPHPAPRRLRRPPWAGHASSAAASWDDERARELEAYLADEIDDNIARGMTPQDAAGAPRIASSATPRCIREEIYEMNTLALHRHASGRTCATARGCCGSNPTFAVVAILTLALGTGANAAIFQLVERGAPASAAGRTAATSSSSIGIEPHDKGRTGRFMSRRPMLHRAALAGASATEQQALLPPRSPGASRRWNLATDGEYAARAGTAGVSGDFFQTPRRRAARRPPAHRGRRPARLRRAGRGARATASGSALRRRVAASSARRSCSTAVRSTIVGVTPPASSASRSAAPSTSRCRSAPSRSSAARRRGFGRARRLVPRSSMGRLKPGWTAERAQAQLEAHLARHLQATLPPRYNAGDRQELPGVQAHRDTRRHRRLGAAPRLRDAAVDPAGRDRAGAAHHLREPGQPDAGARDRARARDRRPPRHRRVPPAHRPADAVREPADRRPGARSAARCWRSGSAVARAVPQHRQQPAVPRPGARLAGLRVHHRAGRPRLPALRARARR